jgi:lysozyme
MTITNILKVEEGFRSKPYLCSNGYVTVGYGTKLHKDLGLDPNDFPINMPEEAALLLLEDDVTKFRMALIESEYGHIFRNLNQSRQDILVSMAYQMGTSGLMKFRKTWKYLEQGHFVMAANEMMDSKWAKQDSPARARRHKEVMLIGELIPVYVN